MLILRVDAILSFFDLSVFELLEIIVGIFALGRIDRVLPVDEEKGGIVLVLAIVHIAAHLARALLHAAPNLVLV